MTTCGSGVGVGAVSGVPTGGSVVVAPGCTTTSPPPPIPHNIQLQLFGNFNPDAQPNTTVASVGTASSNSQQTLTVPPPPTAPISSLPLPSGGAAPSDHGKHQQQHKQPSQPQQVSLPPPPVRDPVHSVNVAPGTPPTPHPAIALAPPSLSLPQPTVTPSPTLPSLMLQLPSGTGSNTMFRPNSSGPQPGPRTSSNPPFPNSASHHPLSPHLTTVPSATLTAAAAAAVAASSNYSTTNEPPKPRQNASVNVAAEGILGLTPPPPPQKASTIASPPANQSGEAFGQKKPNAPSSPVVSEYDSISTSPLNGAFSTSVNSLVRGGMPPQISGGMNSNVQNRRVPSQPQPKRRSTVARKKSLKQDAQEVEFTEYPLENTDSVPQPQTQGAPQPALVPQTSIQQQVIHPQPITPQLTPPAQQPQQTILPQQAPQPQPPLQTQQSPQAQQPANGINNKKAHLHRKHQHKRPPTDLEAEKAISEGDQHPAFQSSRVPPNGLTEPILSQAQQTQLPLQQPQPQLPPEQGMTVPPLPVSSIQVTPSQLQQPMASAFKSPGVVDLGKLDVTALLKYKKAFKLRCKSNKAEVVAAAQAHWNSYQVNEEEVVEAFMHALFNGGRDNSYTHGKVDE
ncbi:hypothetical protein Pelo_6296 [Pelomyxa schiedti]|nr:hypothetical protein Pelo_6296 [Pelomyxa schiedti]